jgi:hypothetical protein
MPPHDSRRRSLSGRMNQVKSGKGNSWGFARKTSTATWICSGGPRLGHSMRANRQTEPQRVLPLLVVCSWLANSPRIAQQSYMLVTEDASPRQTGLQDLAELLGIQMSPGYFPGREQVAAPGESSMPHQSGRETNAT